MTEPHALVAHCRKLACMNEGPAKRERQQIAFDMLQQYEHEGHITADLRLVLQDIVMGNTRLDADRVASDAGQQQPRS